MQVTGANEGEEPEVPVAPVEEKDDEPDYDIETGVEMLTVEVEQAEVIDEFAKDLDFVKSLSGVRPGAKRSMTALSKRMENASGTVGTKRIEDHIITGYNAFEVVLPPYNQDYLAKLYEKCAPHAAAVDAKVANIVGLGFDFIPSYSAQKKIDAVDEPDKAKKLQTKLSDAKQQLFDMLDDLNDEDTFQETLQKVWKDYESTGNGYLEIGRDTQGNIGYLGHVPCVTVRVRRKRDGFVQIIANKAVFFRNFGADDEDPIGHDDNPNELIHLKKYSPSSTFYGVSDIISAMNAVAGNDFAEKFNLDYFENKAVPRHVIVLKGATINPRLAKNILEFFETNLKGKNHRSLFVPLPGDTADKKVDFKITPVEAGIQDASFSKYTENNKNTIFMAHRVPISKVSIAAGVSLASAKDADKTFKEQVCQPEQKVFEKKINKVVKEMTDMFLLKFNELSLTDENTQANIDQMRRKSGTETANEQRVRRGLPSHPDGDSLNNLVPVPNMADAGPPPPIDPNQTAAIRSQEKQSKQQADAAAKAPAAAAPAKTPGGQGSGAARADARAGQKTDTNGAARNPKGEGRTSTA